MSRPLRRVDSWDMMMEPAPIEIADCHETSALLQASHIVPEVSPAKKRSRLEEVSGITDRLNKV